MKPKLIRQKMLLAVTGLFTLLLSWPPTIDAQADPPTAPDEVAKLIAYDKAYNFINYDQNAFEWQDYSAIKPFFDKLQMTRSRKLRILHIGDSHVQADIFTGLIRNKMQNHFGKGGRGLIFPYATARTHAAYDYYTNRSGDWKYGKNTQQTPDYDLGVSGVTAYTEDPNAGFRIVFNQFYYPVENRKVRVYCKGDMHSYELRLFVNGNKQDTVWFHANQNGMSYFEAYLPEAPKVMDFRVVQTDSTQQFFELHGVELQTIDETGVLYSSVGINGAHFKSILNQRLMGKELRHLQPDLVVVDVSGNEYYNGGLNKTTFKSRLDTILQRIHTFAPEASVLVSCSQDINRYRHYSVADCAPAATLARDVAFERNCAFYNYYKVAGKRYSMNKWFAHGLAKYDRVHLTYAGYSTKAELFTNALLNSYHQILSGLTETPFAESLLPKPVFHAKAKPVRSYQPVASGGNGKKIYHTIRSGEVLGTIARRYGVRVSQIRAWNGLRGDFIRAGQRLIIYGNGSAPVAKNTAPTSSSAGSGAPEGTVPAHHTVQSGENYWLIARKYGMSVDHLLKVSGKNRNEKIYPGEQLKLK